MTSPHFRTSSGVWSGALAIAAAWGLVAALIVGVPRIASMLDGIARGGATAAADAIPFLAWIPVIPLLVIMLQKPAFAAGGLLVPHLVAGISLACGQFTLQWILLPLLWGQEPHPIGISCLVKVATDFMIYCALAGAIRALLRQRKAQAAWETEAAERHRLTETQARILHNRTDLGRFPAMLDAIESITVLEPERAETALEALCEAVRMQLDAMREEEWPALREAQLIDRYFACLSATSGVAREWDRSLLADGSPVPPGSVLGRVLRASPEMA